MIINSVVTGIIAVVIAYLLGSVNGAYIFVRLLTGKDIRRLGGGNAGGRNVYRQVGLKAAVPTVIWDLGKGVSSVVIASVLTGAPLFHPNLYVFLAGLAVVAGHMWSVFLKFSGGNGLAASVGALSLLLPWELLIVLGLMGILSLITRNPVLSLNIGLLSLPVSSWFLERSWLAVGFTIALILIMVLNFLPTAIAAIVEAGNAKKLRQELLRQDGENKPKT